LIEDVIKITQLNDFIFCPASIYFHNLYGGQETMLFQNNAQVSGKSAHANIDNNKYSTRADVLAGIDVYSEKYRLVGKIDIFFEKSGLLVERKKKIKKIFDGYIFQLYGQYFAMAEMGYKVNKLKLYSIDDNRSYPVPLPEEDAEMFEKFERLINDIRNFDMNDFTQSNPDKCSNCIYESACDRSIK
jgi:CRISPR-associated exonuclease Cas4